MSSEKRITKRSACPHCGERRLVVIVYGLPLSQDMERAHRTEIAIGGCIVTDDDASYRCGNCAAYIYKDGRFEMPDQWDYFDQLLTSDPEPSNRTE